MQHNTKQCIKTLFNTLQHITTHYNTTQHNLTQGTPKVDTQFMLAKAGAEAVVKTAEQLQKKPEPDATVFTTR